MSPARTPGQGVMIVQFDLHVGIDYSGVETATSRLPALQVFAAGDADATPVAPTVAPTGG